jgi:hydrogenase expression/formation protein HypC
MCLAVPGRLLTLTPAADPDLGATGVVDFGGTRIEVNLAFTPEAGVGDWLLVHAGFALRCLDEAAAREIWDFLRAEGDETREPAALDSDRAERG